MHETIANTILHIGSISLFCNFDVFLFRQRSTIWLHLDKYLVERFLNILRATRLASITVTCILSF